MVFVKKIEALATKKKLHRDTVPAGFVPEQTFQVYKMLFPGNFHKHGTLFEKERAHTSFPMVWQVAHAFLWNVSGKAPST